MAISPDYNYDDLLSLEKAKLIGRERQNFLDTKELVLDYNNISSKTKEDCVEWLETSIGGGGGGRLSLVNPEFSFKTYEGTWTCVSITYNEDAKVIRQTFKIDSSIGDLGDVDVEADFGAQEGDTSRISDGMEVQRAYYWRITDPERIVLPSTARNGEIWTKTANDNGDGSYDVTVAREIAVNLEAQSNVQAGPINAVDLGAYSEVEEIDTNTTEQLFVDDGGTVPDAIIGEIKSITNVPLENGKFRTTVTTRTAQPQHIPPDSEDGGPNWPWLEYGSDFITDANNIIIGRNQTWDYFITDRDRTNVFPAIEKINSISVRVNDFGLYDYTITSNTPG